MIAIGLLFALYGVIVLVDQYRIRRRRRQFMKALERWI